MGNQTQNAGEAGIPPTSCIIHDVGLGQTTQSNIADKDENETVAKAILFGLGGAYESMRARLREYAEHAGVEIIGYSDNNASKADDVPDGTFCTPASLKNKDFDRLYISCGYPYNKQIKKQCIEEIGISADKIYDLQDLMFILDMKEFAQDVELYNQLNRRPEFCADADRFSIYFGEKSSNGASNYKYLLQDLWAARRVYEESPDTHYDIGSRLDGFITHLLSFRKNIVCIDIRPFSCQIDGLSYICSDATNLKMADNSIESLSSLSATEHFGLGRYGDAIDPEGCFRAMAEYQRVLKPGGHLYYAVPVSWHDYTAFHAMRAFHPLTVVRSFSKLRLLEFYYITNNSKSLETMDLKNAGEDVLKRLGESSFGLFEFVK